jgi:phosphate starvation-inducible PhoH-like protein
VRQQLFKETNIGSGWDGGQKAKISVHIYDSEGKLEEQERQLAEGTFRRCAHCSKDNRQLLHNRGYRRISGRADSLGARLRFPQAMFTRGDCPARMTETRTLQFESARALQSPLRQRPQTFEDAEDSLGVKVPPRQGWVKIEGEPAQLDRAQVFNQWEQARQKGSIFTNTSSTTRSTPSTKRAEDNLNDAVATKIMTSSRKAPIVTRTLGQKNYVEAIQAHDIVFGIGPAGTGKTYLAVAMAVAALKKEQVARIILTRPAVEAGEALGFLPGDLQEKITPYLRPLYDALRDMLEPEEIERAVSRLTIEVAPLAYMRGRTLSNAFVILDEAQNTCYHGTNVHVVDSIGANSNAL